MFLLEGVTMLFGWCGNLFRWVRRLFYKRHTVYIYLMSGNIIKLSRTDFEWTLNKEGKIIHLKWECHTKFGSRLKEVNLDHIEAIVETE